jgi:predicted peroxiredoxin
VAGFISEWWPESNRNGGRHQIGIPGRIASEFALRYIVAAQLAKVALGEVLMTETARDLVILMTRGTDHELSSVAFTIANGGLTAGLKVYAFLTSASVDLVRKRAIDLTHVPPLDPLSALVADFLKRGGVIWACPPCVTARGYTQDDFIEGVTIQGASAMHALIQKGAATLSF